MYNLRQLAGTLTDSFLPTATRNRNFFVNAIGSDIEIGQNREWIASVISGMLSTVVGYSRDTCIRLTAKKMDSVIIVEIQESGSVNSYTMACALQKIQSLAEKIGGSLHLSINKPQTTTISFSFPNLPLVPHSEYMHYSTVLYR